MAECKAAIQRTLNKLEKQSGSNFWKFSTGKYTFLNLRQGEPMQQDRLGTTWLQSSWGPSRQQSPRLQSPGLRHPGVPADNSNMSHQCILKVSCVLGYTSKSVLSRLREVILACRLHGTCEVLPGGLCAALNSLV